MSKRLQVLFDPKEYKQLSNAARTSGLSIGEWVRQVVRASLKGSAIRPGEEKLRIVRALAKNNFPSGSIDSILEDIEKGRR